MNGAVPSTSAAQGVSSARKHARPKSVTRTFPSSIEQQIGRLEVAMEDEVPEAQKAFVGLNREMAATCPPITDRKEPLARRPAES
jgi:hypothetical protein